MDLIIFSASFTVILFLISLTGNYFDRRLPVGACLLFALCLGLDDLATVLPSLSPLFNLFDFRWNWEGKIYSILLSILIITGLRLNKADAGITFTAKNLKTSILALAGFTLLSALLGIIFQPGPPTAETIAFQLFMPGIAEELAYRGIAPAILIGSFKEKSGSGFMPWSVIMITAFAFGLWHGLGYSDGSFSFDTMSSLFPFIGGVLYGWLRFHSGTLLFPILAHGFGNAAFVLVSHF